MAEHLGPICGRKGCKRSTGIHEGVTCGTGDLDDNGFWEFPCHVCERHETVCEERDAVLARAEYAERATQAEYCKRLRVEDDVNAERRGRYRAERQRDEALARVARTEENHLRHVRDLTDERDEALARATAAEQRAEQAERERDEARARAQVAEVAHAEATDAANRYAADVGLVRRQLYEQQRRADMANTMIKTRSDMMMAAVARAEQAEGQARQARRVALEEAAGVATAVLRREHERYEGTDRGAEELSAMYRSLAAAEIHDAIRALIAPTPDKEQP